MRIRRRRAGRWTTHHRSRPAASDRTRCCFQSGVPLEEGSSEGFCHCPTQDPDQRSQCCVGRPGGLGRARGDCDWGLLTVPGLKTWTCRLGSGLCGPTLLFVIKSQKATKEGQRQRWKGGGGQERERGNYKKGESPQRRWQGSRYPSCQQLLCT